MSNQSSNIKRTSSRTVLRKSSSAQEKPKAGAPVKRWAASDIGDARFQAKLSRMAETIPLRDVPEMLEFLRGKMVERGWGNGDGIPLSVAEALATLEERTKSIPAKPPEPAPMPVQQAEIPPGPPPAAKEPNKWSYVDLADTDGRKTIRTLIETISNPDELDELARALRDKMAEPGDDETVATYGRVLLKTIAVRKTKLWDVDDLATTEGVAKLEEFIAKIPTRDGLDELADAITRKLAPEMDREPPSDLRIQGDRLLQQINARRTDFPDRTMVKTRRDAQSAIRAATKAQEDAAKAREAAAAEEAEKAARNAHPLVAGKQDDKLITTWTEMLRGGKEKEPVLEDHFGKTSHWKDMPQRAKDRWVGNVKMALSTLASSRVPAIQSIMRVAAVGLGKNGSTAHPLAIRLVDPIAAGSTDSAAAGQADPHYIEVAPYQKGSDHKPLPANLLKETTIHELTHWIAFNMYGTEGNPPYLNTSVANKRKEVDPATAEADEAENEQRKATIESAEAGLAKAREANALVGDLSVLNGISEYDRNIWYKEMLPHILEFIARAESDDDPESIEKVLAGGGPDLAAVKQAAEQFSRDLERYAAKVDDMEKVRAKDEVKWAKMDSQIW